MGDQNPNFNLVTNLMTDNVEVQSTLSPITNVTQLFDSNIFLRESTPSTCIGLPEVSTFSTLVQPFSNIHNQLEQFTTNVVSQPQQRMEVGESSHRRTPLRRSQFNQQVAQGEEGNFRRSQDTRLHHIQRTHTHSQSERKRRGRIRERIIAIKELVPECDKNTTADVLDAATNYIRVVHSYLQIMSMGTLVQNIQRGSGYGMGWSSPPLGLQMISNHPTLGCLPPPQEDAEMMAYRTFHQTRHRPPQLPMSFGQPGILAPRPQPSRFTHGSFPPSLYTSVAPSVFVPPNFSSSNQDWVNQGNPDGTNDLEQF